MIDSCPRCRVAATPGNELLGNNMIGISATETEILACFGVEPVLLDTNVPWCYNEATYLIDVDGLTVSFVIQPSYRYVWILIFRGTEKFFEFNATGVTDIRVIDEPGIDALEVILSESSSLRMQLRPTLTITQKLPDCYSFNTFGPSVR